MNAKFQQREKRNCARNLSDRCTQIRFRSSFLRLGAVLSFTSTCSSLFNMSVSYLPHGALTSEPIDTCLSLKQVRFDREVVNRDQTLTFVQIIISGTTVCTVYTGFGNCMEICKEEETSFQHYWIRCVKDKDIFHSAFLYKTASSSSRENSSVEMAIEKCEYMEKWNISQYPNGKKRDFVFRIMLKSVKMTTIHDMYCIPGNFQFTLIYQISEHEYLYLSLPIIWYITKIWTWANGK